MENKIRDERIKNNTNYEYGEEVLVLKEKIFDEGDGIVKNILKETMNNGKLGKTKRGGYMYVIRLMSVLDYRDGNILIGNWSGRLSNPHPYLPTIEVDNDMDWIHDTYSKYHQSNSPKIWLVFKSGIWVKDFCLRKKNSTEHKELQITDSLEHIESLRDRIKDMEEQIREEKKVISMITMSKLTDLRLGNGDDMTDEVMEVVSND